VSDIVDKHLGDHVKLDLSSILKGQVKIDGSQYVDQMLEKVVAKLESKGLNEMHFPDVNTTFSKSLFCLPLPGEANFKQLLLTGLSQIKRFTPTEVLVDVHGDKIITAKAAIGIPELALSSPTFVKVLFLESETMTKAILKDTQLSVGLGISRDFKVALDEFDINTIGKLTNLAGLPDFLLDTVSENLQEAVEENLRKILDKDLKALMSEIVQKFEMLL